jgi:hypothetical protein
VLTYDSLLRHYKSGEGRRCNIITLSKEKIRFKFLHAHTGNIFSYVGPADMLLSEADKRKLRRAGIPIKAWETYTPVPNVRIRKMALAQKKRVKKAPMPSGAVPGP